MAHRRRNLCAAEAAAATEGAAAGITLLGTPMSSDLALLFEAAQQPFFASQPLPSNRPQPHASDDEPTYRPHINERSAQIVREMPVEEILLGRGRAAAHTREQLAARQEMHAVREAMRPPDKSWQGRTRHAQYNDQYENRHRQTARERLLAAKRRPVPPPARAARSNEAVLGVAERNAAWAQGRVRRMQQLSSRARLTESRECPFQPAGLSQTVIFSPAGGEQRGEHFFERNMQWAAAREQRLEARRLAAGPGSPIVLRSAPLEAWVAGEAGAETNFMAPTQSTRAAAALLMTPSAMAAEQRCTHVSSAPLSELPEWAVPR
jgi:hypothetical protein